MAKAKSKKMSKKDKEAMELLIKRSWQILIICLVLTLVAEVVLDIFFEPKKAYFPLADITLFNALYGFIACLAIIVFSKYLGKMLKRPADFYDEGDE